LYKEKSHLQLAETSFHSAIRFDSVVHCGAAGGQPARNAH